MNRVDDRDCDDCPDCGNTPAWGDCRCWDDGTGAMAAQHAASLPAKAPGMPVAAFKGPGRAMGAPVSETPPRARGKRLMHQLGGTQ